jgi:very-long-chain enoyl-CoA reductase
VCVCVCVCVCARSHVTLANLRKPGEKGYKIPKGGLFNFVTCANYTYETLGWVFYTVAVQALPAAIFTLVGGAQMAQWAVAKHKRLIKVRLSLTRGFSVCVAWMTLCEETQ